MNFNLCKSLTFASLVFIFLTFLTPDCFARIVYVSPDGIPDGTGADWETAFNTITAGLTVSASGDEIWVRSATYHESVEMREGIALYGGFAGNETDRTSRNWSAHETVIDATGLETSVATGANWATLDGFTLTGGSGVRGSGLYCSETSPIVRNCTISNNSSTSNGGGVHCNRSYLFMTNCIITGNSTEHYGGGIRCIDSNPDFTNCIITGNTARSRGGGVSCYGGFPELDGCIIANNVTRSDSSDSWGGGVYCQSSTLIITSCTISGNQSESFGGGIYFIHSTTSSLINCIIVNNRALLGGAIYFNESSPVVLNCTLTDNVTTRNCGAVCCYRSSPAIINCIVWNKGQEIFLSESSGPIINYSCIQGGWPGEGNIEGEVLFLNAAGGDYHLLNGSAGIDGGVTASSPGKDCEGSPRPGGDGLVDMGAYESDDAWQPDSIDPIPTRWYVRADAPDGGDGRSWASAYTSISSALSITNASDEIWVQSGTYHEAIKMEPRVTIYGGFTGSESSLESRNWAENTTIIDATGQGQPVITGTDYGILDGFTLTGGNVFEGGGLYCSMTSPIVRNCTISNNTADYRGGGVCLTHSSTQLENCTITDNYSNSYGGGIFCDTASAVLTNCTITHNLTDEAGGGISILNNDLTPTAPSTTLLNCKIAQNSAGESGGGIHSIISSFNLINCLIHNNAAISGDGGGLYSFYSRLTLLNCTVADNQAGSEGPGIFLTSFSISSLTNCILWNIGEEIVADEDSNPTIRYSCIQEGWLGEGNISDYPLFVDSSNSDYRLQEHSPCIDRGLVSISPTEDFDHNPRPGSDDLVDMGAYESSPDWLPGQTATEPQQWYVRSDLQAGGDGSSWATAFTSISSALRVAGESDEIWVQQGTYHEVLILEPGITLCGGFTGNESIRDERDWSTNETIIDATGLNSSVIFAAKDSVLDGFTVTGGNTATGGGLYCYHTAVTLKNCTITKNTATESGGGVYCDQSSLTMDNCVIMENPALTETTLIDYGGGIYGLYTSLKLSSCMITGNKARYGGGIYCHKNSSLHLIDCELNSNEATDGGGIYCDHSSVDLDTCVLPNNSVRSKGGGLYCNDSRPELSGCEFFDNSAYHGGGLYFNDSRPELNNCKFQGNSAVYGGGLCTIGSFFSYLNQCLFEDNTTSLKGAGLYCDGSSLTIRNSSFIGNRAHSDGGGLASESDSDLSIENCLFENNTSSDYGGGLYSNYQSSPKLAECVFRSNLATDGGGLFCDSSDSPHVNNCLIENNTAREEGGGIYIESGFTFPLTNCTITGNTAGFGSSGIYSDSTSIILKNSISYNMGEEIASDGDSTIEVQYSCIQGGWPGDGNIDGDPLFINASGSDYHLQEGSACIDRGLASAAPTQDLDGNPRPGTDGLVDMGAYESSDDWQPGPANHSPTRLYVRFDASEGGDGTSWGTAFSTISSALAIAGSSDEIWIKTGTYKEAIAMELGVAMFGGFVGNEIAREERNWIDNVTVIDADDQYRPVVIGANNAILDGFTLTGGRAKYGGGLYCVYASPIVANCTIDGTQERYSDGGGSGIYCLTSSPTLTNCVIKNNASEEDGGGIYCEEYSSPTLTNCIIYDNKTEGKGGGVFCSYHCYPEMINCTIVGNSAYLGGAMYCSSDSSPILTNCTITGNAADEVGGIYQSSSTLLLTNCILWNRGAEFGGSNWDNAMVSFCAVQGGWDGEGNITADPGLTQRWNGSTIDIHLLSGSPCIDAGTTVPGLDTDFEGDPRPSSGGWDIGADECIGDCTPGDPNPGGQIWYVSDNVIGGNGTSWETPLGSITDALERATLFDEIWIQEATYEEAIVLEPGVGLYGGFAGNETERSQRDWKSHSTVIDASELDSSVVRCENIDSATLDGCTLTGGSFHSGGGFYCKSSSPVLSNCTIRGNSADHNGAGVYCLDSYPTLQNSFIVDNSSEEKGGGLYATRGIITITNSIIAGNSAEDVGGGIFDQNGLMTLTNCTLIANSGIEGSGAYCDHSKIDFANCILWNRGSEIGGTNTDNVTVTYCAIQEFWPGEGNLTDSPGLTKWWDGKSMDVHLLSGSPCIDAGAYIPDVLTDFEGDLRTSGSGWDIGADECVGDCEPGDPQQAGRIWYVSASAVGGDGSSWDSPLPSISGALTLAAHRDEIWIRSATYTEALILETGIGLYGGFKGNETKRDQRNWEAYPTIIDASGLGCSVASCIDISSVTLDGVTLTGGSSIYGGGVYCLNSSPQLINCKITENFTTYQGSGFYCNYSSPILTNCMITENTSQYGSGGGIFCDEDNSIELTNCTVTNNTAWGWGGGIICRNDDSSIFTDCTFAGNSSKYGGGFCAIYQSSPILTRCIVIDNSASDMGGGLYFDNYSSPSLFNCTISNNSAENKGGGIYCNSSKCATLTRCTISKNTSNDTGGGLSCQGNKCTTLTNCAIIGNTAAGYGGALECNYSPLKIENCTIVGNSATDGGGISSRQSASELTNCILWNNSEEIAVVADEYPVLTYCCIKGGWPGEGNIDSDPLFVKPWDGTGADLQLQFGSPCIDTGTSIPYMYTDLAGNPRPVDIPGIGTEGPGAFDMGVYERQLLNVGDVSGPAFFKYSILWQHGVEALPAGINETEFQILDTWYDKTIDWKDIITTLKIGQ